MASLKIDRGEVVVIVAIAFAAVVTVSACILLVSKSRQIFKTAYPRCKNESRIECTGSTSRGIIQFFPSQRSSEVVQKEEMYMVSATDTDTRPVISELYHCDYHPRSFADTREILYNGTNFMDARCLPQQCPCHRNHDNSDSILQFTIGSHGNADNQHSGERFEIPVQIHHHDQWLTNFMVADPFEPCEEFNLPNGRRYSSVTNVAERWNITEPEAAELMQNVESAYSHHITR